MSSLNGRQFADRRYGIRARGLERLPGNNSPVKALFTAARPGPCRADPTLMAHSKRMLYDTIPMPGVLATDAWKGMSR